MNNEEIRAFKNELRNYKYWLRKIKGQEELLKVVYYGLAGVHGVDPDKVHVDGSPEAAAEAKLRAYDEIDRINTVIEKAQERIREADGILEQIDEDTRNAIKAVYICGRTMESEARKRHMVKNALYERIMRSLAKLDTSSKYMK